MFKYKGTLLACRPMVVLACALITGVLIQRSLPGAYQHLWVGIGLLLILSIHFHYTPQPQFSGEQRYLAQRGLNRFILLLGLSFALAGIAIQHSWNARLDPSRLPAARWFDARVQALAPAHDYPGEKGAWHIPALLLQADGKILQSTVIRLNGPDGAPFERGDILTARLRKEWIDPPAFPGAFDYQSWLENNGMAAVCSIDTKFAPKGQPYTVSPNPDFSPYLLLRALCDRVRGIGTALTLQYGGAHGPMLAAMIFGYRKSLDSTLRDVFRRVGIGHVLAISGLHVGLIISLVWQFFSLFDVHVRKRALLCSLFALLYLFLTGAQTAPARATLMALIHLTGIIIGRPTDMLNSLAAAGIIIIALNPSTLFDVGFQLSFLSILFIYIALRYLPGLYKLQLRIDGLIIAHSLPLPSSKPFLQLMYLSAATWVGLFPICAIAFHQANLIGLPINIIVVPLMSVVLALGLFVPFFGWIPGVSTILCLPADCLNSIAKLSDSIPYSSFPIHAPAQEWVCLFYLFCGLLLCTKMLTKSNHRVPLIVSTIYLCIAASFLGTLISTRSRQTPTQGRLAILPGRGLNMIAAEAPDGSIALLGRFSRGGATEADWLHSLHRSGPVNIVAIGTTTTERLAPLSYHYPLHTMTNLPRDKYKGTKFLGWTPIPGCPGIEYAAGFAPDGSVTWLATRTNGKTICTTQGLTQARMEELYEQKLPFAEANLLHTGLTDEQVSFDSLRSMASGVVALSGRRRSNMPPGWTERWKYGAMVLENDGIFGYNGTLWQHIPTRYTVKDPHP